MSQTTDKPAEQEQDSTNIERSLPEKVTFGAALGMLAAIIGAVAYVWLGTESDRPPVLAIEQTEAVREADGHYYIPFELTNTGGETAEAVHVTAELTVQGKVVESGEQEFDFLSGDESAEGAFVFSEDPRSGDLNLRVTGYRLP